MRTSILFLFSTALLSAQILGFETNRGAAPSKVKYLARTTRLFGDGCYFTANSLVTSRGLRLTLAAGNRSSEIVGEMPVAFRSNTYLGNEPSVWRENDTRYSSVRMKQIYSGVDAVWDLSGRSSGVVVMRVAAGARPSDFRFRVGEGDTRIELESNGMIRFPSSGITGATVGARQSGLDRTARFRRVDDSTFAIDIDSYDANSPGEIWIAFTNFNNPLNVRTNQTYFDSAIVPAILPADLDSPSDASKENYDHFVATTDATGKLAWLTVLGGRGEEIGYNDTILAVGERLVAASASASDDYPITSGAPQTRRSEPRLPNQTDLILLALDKNSGKLLVSSYFGGAGRDYPAKVTTDRFGNFVVTGGTEKGVPATPGALNQAVAPERYGGFILKWDFQSSRFLFAASLSNVAANSEVGNSGAVHFSSPAWSPQESITIGALSAGGTQLLYSAVIPNPTDYSFQSQSLRSISRGDNGDVAVLNSYSVYGQAAGGFSERLWMSVYSTSERRMRFQRFLNERGGWGQVRLTSTGLIEVAMQESFPTSPTSTHAILTASCGGAYFQRLDGNGNLLGASYLLPVPAPTNGYDFPEGDPLTAGAAPAIHCAVPTSHRLPNSGSLAPGQLITITGGNFGPTEAIYASPDASGRFPFVLAGISATVGGLPAPIIAVARGLVAVQIPFEAAEVGPPAVVVTVNGNPLGPISIGMSGKALSFFHLGVVDKELRLPITAALNQDGTVNSRLNPAARGSYISIFATGLGRSPGNELVTGGLAPLDRLVPYELPYRFGIYPAEFSFAGAAPGLSTGLYQLNLRIPDDMQPGAFGLSFERNVGKPSILPPPTSIFFVK